MKNFNVTSTFENKKSKTVFIIVCALMIVGIVVGIIALNNTKNKTVKEINDKIEQVQKETQQAIVDSLNARGINEKEIRVNRIWNAQYDMDHMIERSLGDCPISKLFSTEEIEHMNDALFKQQEKRELELNPVSALQMACLNFYIDENTTLEELSERVVYLFGYQAERYGPLLETIRFPDDDNPFIIVSKDNDLFITKTDAVIKNLSKEQKEKYLSAVLTMTTAQKEMEVVQDVKEYFYEKADKEIEPLLHKLVKKDPNFAIKMQKNILSTRR